MLVPLQYQIVILEIPVKNGCCFQFYGNKLYMYLVFVYILFIQMNKIKIIKYSLKIECVINFFIIFL